MVSGAMPRHVDLPAKCLAALGTRILHVEVLGVDVLPHVALQLVHVAADLALERPVVSRIRDLLDITVPQFPVAMLVFFRCLHAAARVGRRQYLSKK